MKAVIKELADWLIEEFYYDNFKKARRIVKVLNSNGYDINYDELQRAKYYMHNDYLDCFNISSMLKRRK